MMPKVGLLDMDGCIVDFVKGALALHGKSLSPGAIRWDFCAQIGFASANDPRFWAGMGYDFWAHLDWTTEGRELLLAMEAAFGHDNIGLLSSPCLTAGCADGKRDWVAREMPGYRSRLILASAKHLVAGQGKVLIDDNDSNCGAFRDHGGQAILIPRPWNSRRGETDDLGHFDVLAIARQIRTLAGA